MGSVSLFLISLWAIKRAFNDFIIVVKGESVVDQWNMIIEQAANKGQQLLNTTEGFIKEARIPNHCVFSRFCLNIPLWSKTAISSVL